MVRGRRSSTRLTLCDSAHVAQSQNTDFTGGDGNKSAKEGSRFCFEVPARIKLPPSGNGKKDTNTPGDVYDTCQISSGMQAVRRRGAAIHAV